MTARIVAAVLLCGSIASDARPASRPATAPTTSPWGRESKEQLEASVQQMKQRAQTWLASTPAKLQLHETQYFLFYSDLGQTQAGKWVGVLDQMYARLADLFAVPKGTNVWHGKAIIFVFQNRTAWENFEKAAFQIDRKAGGRCHPFGDGTVLVTFYVWGSDMEFARVLVHESTHGFVFRYHSEVTVPNWANEGLAEVMEYELVPHAGLKQANDAKARSELHRPDPLKNFFDARNIEGFQYPIARTLCEFMIKQNKKGYVEFVNGIKDGMSWEQSLNAKYGVTLERLMQAYGETMGVKGLHP